MCLHKSTKMQVADEDITCYKIIEIHHLTDGSVIYQSYYQETEIRFDVSMEAADKMSIESLNMHTVLNGEVVHAYVKLPHLSDDRLVTLQATTAYWLNPTHVSADIAIIECTIPKGTYYCLGKDSYGIPNYGALTIIPNSIIKVFNCITQK